MKFKLNRNTIRHEEKRKPIKVPNLKKLRLNNLKERETYRDMLTEDTIDEED